MLRPSPRPWLVLATLLALLLSIACRGTGRAPPAERWLSARCLVALVVPSVGRAARELTVLEGTLSGFPGVARQLAGLRSALTSQLGFDPLDAEAIARAGIEPAGGMALGAEPPADDGGPATPVVIVPLRDSSSFLSVVSRIARDRLGAPERSESVRGAIRLVTFRSGAAGAAALSLALSSSERVAALAPGPAGPDVVVAALSRPLAESLAEVPAWRELREALLDRTTFLAGAVPPSPGLPSFAPEGLALGSSVAPGEVRLVLAARLGVRASSLRALRAAGDSRPALRSLAPDAALVLRWDGDPGELGKHLLSRVPAKDRAWLEAHGFDLQRDLFDQLAPGAAAALSVSPRLDLSDLSDVALRADPLRLVRFELAGEVKDPSSAKEALVRLPALLAALARPVSGASPGPPLAPPGSGRFATPSGEISWQLDGRRLSLAGGPPGSLAALLAREHGAPGYSAPTAAAAGALEGGLGGAVLAPRRLAASLRALPEESFGTGPAGFLVRSFVLRFLEPADRVAAISLKADLGEKALLVEARIETPSAAGKGGAR